MSTPGIADWLDLMPAFVVVAGYAGADSYGVASYTTPRTYQARVTYRTRRITSSAGEDVVSRGEAWLATVDPVTVKDRITLPEGGRPPLILDVQQVADENGPLYTKLYFA